MKEQLKRYILFWIQQVFEIAVPLAIKLKIPFYKRDSTRKNP